MRKLTLIFILYVLSQTFAFSDSLKHNDLVSLSNIRVLLGIYKDRHAGNLPKDWRSFIDSGILSGSLLEDARKYLNIENRYRFINSPVSFSSSGESFKIIVMANSPGGEGDTKIIAENGQVEVSPGRYVVIETGNGTLQTRGYSEVALKHIFEEAKLNLEDFTAASPPPPEFNPPSREPNSEGVALGGPENPNDGNTRAVKNPSKRESKPRSQQAEGGTGSTNTQLWVIWIAVGISAIGLLAWFVKRRLQNRISKHDSL